MNDDVWSAIEADASLFEGLTTETGGELSDLIRQVTDVRFDTCKDAGGWNGKSRG